ncbi:MAG: A/G-specific adenine glycosylase [Nitrospinota bacterium]
MVRAEKPREAPSGPAPEDRRSVGRLWKSLLTWYGREKRDLPWRRSRDPYHIWVSEVMLHQTRVETVLPYYEAFLKRFPDVPALALARLGSVLRAWEGLGYYARVRNLHRAARIVERDYGGRLPEDPAALSRLPGIGPYTVGAILSIAYGARLPALDGNVRRVLSRLFGVDSDPADPSTRRRLEGLAGRFVSHGRPPRPGDVNQALMDLGARVCIPRKPRCLLCPFRAHCIARLSGRVNGISGALLKPNPKAVAFSCLLARGGGGRVLLAQNPAEGLFGGLWELPGGECDPGKSPADALPRLLLDRAGLRVDGAELAGTFTATLTHRRITYHVYEGGRVRSAGKPGAYVQIRWVRPQDLERLPVSKAQRKILRALLEKHPGSPGGPF